MSTTPSSSDVAAGARQPAPPAATSNRNRGRRLTKALAAPALFGLLTLVFFHPLVVEDKTFAVIAGHQSIQYPWAAAPTGYPDSVQSDQANNGYPIQADLNRSLRDGVFPYWSPYSFSGGPTLGTFYGIGFYPPRFAASLLVPPIWVHDLIVVFHVWLAGFAMFLLLRRIGGSWLAAVFGGVAWMFCPAWFSLALLEGSAILAATLPLALWLMHRAVTRRSVPDAAACGAVLALLVLGASLQPAVFAFLIVCLWGLALGWQETPAGERRAALLSSARPVAIAGALGVALCAFVVLPATAQIGDSGRTEIPYGEMLMQDVGFDDLSHVVDPGVPQPLTGDGVWALTFLGIPAALLALVGFFSRRPGTGLGRWLVVLFVLLMLGTPLTRVAYETVPGFPYLSPMGRLLPFAALGAVILAAVGLDVTRDALLRRTSSRRWAGAVAVGAAVVVIAVQAWQVMDFSHDVNPPFQPRQTAYLYPGTGLLDALSETGQARRAGGDVQRIVPVRRGAPDDPFSPPPLVGETPRLFEIETVGGYMNVIPRRSRVLSLVLSGEAPARALAPLVGAYAAFYFSATTRFDLLERMGVGEIVAPPDAVSDPPVGQAVGQLGARTEYAGVDGTLLALPRALPRAFVVDGVEPADGEAEALDRFADPGFPFRTTAVIEGEPSAARTGAPLEATARVLPSGPDERDVAVDTPRAGWLVVLDSWDRGWNATVDGRETPVRRADFAYRAVRVPAGRSVVEMEYRTPGLGIGITLSVLGLLGALACWLWPLRGRRLRSASS
jgi:hypothetical protein